MKPRDRIAMQRNDCKASINGLQQEIERLEVARQQATKATGIEQWVGFTFRSSCSLTEEFRAFAKDFKACIKKIAGDEYELCNFSGGHFYCSGFLKQKSTGKYVYFSISDVRHFPDEWYRHMLIRTAKHDKDWTGGANCFTGLKDLKQAIDKLI